MHYCGIVLGVEKIKLPDIHSMGDYSLIKCGISSKFYLPFERISLFMFSFLFCSLISYYFANFRV